MQNTKHKLVTIFLLAPFIFAFAFALDIFVPSLPEIRTYFNSTESIVQWTIGIFLLMTGIGQLVSGPISDRFGRKIIILSGAFCFLIGCVLAVYSPSIAVLIVARLIQGFGACSMMVATFAMVRDLFLGDEVAEVFGYLNAGVGLSPSIAPIIGSYLAKGYGWRSGFIFLAVLGAIMLLMALFCLKESLTREYRTRLDKAVFQRYLTVLKNKTFLMYTFCASAGFGALLVYFSVSSYLLIGILHIPEQDFGYYFAIFGASFFVGSILGGYISRKKGPYLTVFIALLMAILSGIIMLVTYLTVAVSVASFMGPMTLMGMSGAMLMGGGAGGAIEPFPEIAGTASAVFGACEFIFGFVLPAIVLAWRVTSTLPLSVTIIVLNSTALLFCILRDKK